MADVFVRHKLERDELETLLHFGSTAVCPFYHFLSKIASVSSDNPKISWLVETGEPDKELAEDYNYLQIFRRRVPANPLSSRCAVYGMSTRRYELAKKVIEQAKDFEAAYLYGDRHEFVEGCTHIRRMGGLSYYGNHITEVRPFITPEGIVNDDILERVWRTPGGRYALVPWKLYTGIIDSHRFIQIPIDKTFGIPIKQYLSRLGSLNVIQDDILNVQQDVFIFSFGSSLITNTHKLERVYLKDRDWHGWELPEYEEDVGSDEAVKSVDSQGNVKYSPKIIKNEFSHVLLCEQGLRVLGTDFIYIIHFSTSTKDKPEVKGIPEGSCIGQGED